MFHISVVLCWLARPAQQTFFGSIIGHYMLLTGTAQGWRTFAPDPPLVDQQLIVNGVKSMSPAWKNIPPLPVYDPNPIYVSDHDQRLGYFLIATRAEVFLKPFAEYWAHVYEKERGHLPVGIDIVSNEGRVSPIFGGSQDTTPTYGRQVIWQTKF